MRTSPLRAVIGVTSGLILALAVATAPASAAPPSGSAPITSSYSCATFDNLTVQSQKVAYSGVALTAGQQITANVSPASSYDIQLTTSVGLDIGIYSAPSATGLVFTAPGSTVYNLTWSVPSGPTAGLVWTFTCSTGGSGGGGTPTPTADSDKDGVADATDVCSGTVLPDSFGRTAAGSYYADRSGLFIDGTGRSSGITVADAGGCSGAQIAKKLGLKSNQTRAGIPLSTLQSWAAAH